MSSNATASGTLALVVGLAAVVGVTLWMLRDPAPPAPPGAPPAFQIPVTIVHPTLGDVTERVTVTGDVRAPDRAQIAFERGGRVLELNARLGDRVQAGMVLARLDDRVMEHQVKAREASLTQAREMAALAERDADRMEKIEGTVASDAEVDRARAVERNEAARVVQLEADLALERTRLEQGVLLAPFDAVVTGRPISLGSYVESGASCFELLSLESREILLELPPRVATQLLPGSGVTIESDELPGFALECTLTTVLPATDPRARVFTGVVRVEPDADPQNLLVPGLFVRASASLRSIEGALTVPIDCLVEDGAGVHVVVVQRGEAPTAGFVAVRVLARDAERAAIEALGDAVLSVEDSVVLVGKENAAPGLPLAVAPAAASAP
jgi:multidrug efflux system membrane fusion protein